MTQIPTRPGTRTWGDDMVEKFQHVCGGELIGCRCRENWEFRRDAENGVLFGDMKDTMEAMFPSITRKTEDMNEEKKPDPIEDIMEAVAATLSPIQESLKKFRESQDIARVAMRVRETGKPETIHGVLLIPKGD